MNFLEECILYFVEQQITLNYFAGQQDKLTTLTDQNTKLEKCYKNFYL